MTPQTQQQIVLVSCAREKVSHRALVEDLYTSNMFRLSLQYARTLRPKGIYVLSAKHGLLPLNKEIDPYDVTLNNMRAPAVKAWAADVFAQIEGVCDVNATEVVILAGERYRKYLLPYLPKVALPLRGLTFGLQIRRLKELVS